MTASAGPRFEERLRAGIAPPADAILVGRVWVEGGAPGPRVVRVDRGEVLALDHVATVSELLNAPDPVAATLAGGRSLGTLDRLGANSAFDRRDRAMPYFMAPCDLQAVKASGVTFATSLLERVIEEQARGEAGQAEAFRRRVHEAIGNRLEDVRPGSEAAERLKETLIALGAWSPYLEVAIGPYAEIFTKAQPMSALGTGAEIGLHPDSAWSNSEPEIVLAVNAGGTVVGAALGNDLNLRDIEGRSALLLGKAKDNNGSCAIGPFIRLFDARFSLDDVRRAEIALTVEGADGFRLEGRSAMAKITRDPLDLVAQMMGAHHQYPDGAMLFLGTMFAPVADRGEAGRGFTHHIGDIVTISTPALGSLVNRVNRSDRIPPWTFGTGALMRSLAAQKASDRRPT